MVYLVFLFLLFWLPTRRWKTTLSAISAECFAKVLLHLFFCFFVFFQGFIKPYSSNVKRDVTTDTRQMVAPRHDINAPGAVVMPRPSATHQVIIEHRDWFCIVVVRHQESLTSRKLEWKLWKGSGVEEVVRWNCLFSLSVVLLAVELEWRSSIVIGQFDEAVMGSCTM